MRKITKEQFYRLGGFSNPELVRLTRDGVWAYFERVRAMTITHHLHHYTTTLRDCWSTVDDFGNLVPINHSGLWFFFQTN